MWASDWPAVAIPPTYEPTSGSRWHPGQCGVAARRAERLLLVKRYANVYSVEGSRRQRSRSAILGESRACLPATFPPSLKSVAVGHAPPLYKSWTPFPPFLHLSLSSPLIHWLCIQAVTRFNTSLPLSQHERIPWLLLVVTFRPLRASSAPKSLSLVLPVSSSFPSVSTSSQASRLRTAAMTRSRASSSRSCSSATLAS